MAKVTTDLTVVIKTAGDAGLDKLTRTLNGLGRQAKSAAAPFDQISKELKEVQSTSKNSIANLRGYRNAWRDITEQVEIGSAAFKQATAEAARLDKQLQKAEGRKAPGGGGRLKGIAQGVGAIAAGGVFGGPEGALGGTIGLAAGGPTGAAVGAAIGAQVGQLRQAVGATAEYSASLEKLRIALFGVTTSQQEYTQSLEFIAKTSEELAIPQDILTRQFTKLQASVLGAGGSVKDTKLAFRGIVAAVRATGGSLQDVDSALTATAQVFSKGKVSAEELRQQIGERLPGAFTLFAESIGKTPQELDKALEQGEVSLEDFLTFTKAIFDRYDKNAQIIVDSPAAAGDRLTQKLKELQEAVGILVEPVGAAFQGAASVAVDALTGITKKIDELFEKFKFLTEMIKILGPIQASMLLGPAGGALASIGLSGLGQGSSEDVDIRGNIQQPKKSTGLPKADDEEEEKPGSRTVDRTRRTSKDLLDLAIQRNQAFAEGNKIRVAQLTFDIEIQKLSEQFNAGQIDANTQQLGALKAEEQLRRTGLKLREDEKRAMRDLTKGQKEFKQELTETEKLAKNIKDTFATGMTSAIEGLIFGTKSLGESLSGILKQMASLFLKAGIGSFGSGGDAGTGLLGLFANGGVVAQNKVVPFASGGIVNKPTIFPMANGMGLMGEAGPEAIMPLRRGANGKLGVESSGGGVGNVVVNVDATGSNVQGDQPNADRLGKVIGQAVQAELIKQKRPGGLLTR